MGTRSTLHIKDGKKTLASIYRQHDGYPTGMGTDIKKLLNNGKVELRNGYNGGDSIPSQFNGLQCLGAFIIGALKGDSIGGIYLTDSKDRQEYNYFLSQKNELISLKVTDYDNKTIFNGLLTEFDGETVEKKAYGDD